MTNPTPHILVVNVFFAPYTYGGATHVAEQVAINLVNRHRFRVSAFSAMSRPEFSPYSVLTTEKNGIVNHIVNLPAHRHSKEQFSNQNVRKAFSEVVRDINPDVIHFHCVQDLGADLLSAARELGKEIILSIHDFWWLCERQFMIKADGTYCAQDPIRVEACAGCVKDMRETIGRLEFLKTQATHAAIVTYPSHFSKSLYERSGFFPRKGVVLRNGIIPPSSDFFTKQARRRELDPRLVFGYVGGPSPIKGWPIIQDTFRRLKRKNFKGILVDASLDQSWYSPNAYAGMSGEWSVRKRYDSITIDDFYAEIDVLLFPSQWKETFGLTIREALSRGVYVVQTDGGGTIEHEGTDRTSLLQIGEGSEKLERIVLDLLENPDTVRIEPLNVHSFAEQADELVDIIKHLGAL
ncbi:glycosyltransferase involved in cell wall biosynthesis [Albidovulum inexpectatum]|uniref:Glycosyltransferase involved in cell wall biosynthesis n=1 Tax=Albidovulum inexpectatum TaxID=196587 RepID=A0A2S5JEJ3_9RHOB|nr:glycosyltransferase family 4 protein [Albidovulum inexpectatum]PPB79942.1 glycosyltransferase involved in cell wall biosynthesis [Albidovulum inexpectatum]